MELGPPTSRWFPWQDRADMHCPVCAAPINLREWFTHVRACVLIQAHLEAGRKDGVPTL